MRFKMLTVAGVTALVATMVAAPAEAATTQIRQADFIAGLSDTRAQGTVDFLREGLRVVTGDNTAAAGAPANNKAAEYFAITGGIPSTGSYEWTGTGTNGDNTQQPGAQIVFDLDGDRANANSFNVLVGERVYSTNGDGANITDWWYTGGADRAADRGIRCPGAATTGSPASGATPRVTAPTPTGGSGSNCHGSLAAWQSNLPNAQAYAGGFSLGSGVKGAGILRAVTLGDTTYEFTDTPAASPAPTTPAAGATTTTGSVTATVPTRFNITTGSVVAKKNKALGRVRVKIQTNALTAGTVEGKKINYVVKADGRRVFQSQLGAGQRSVHLSTFNRTGKHVVTVLADGKVVKKVKINR